MPWVTEMMRKAARTCVHNVECTRATAIGSTPRGLRQVSPVDVASTGTRTPRPRVGLSSMARRPTPSVRPGFHNLTSTFQTLSELPTYLYEMLTQESGESDPDMCTICLESFDAGDQMRRLPCMHHFHTFCIDEWIYQQSIAGPRHTHGCRCPNCNQVITIRGLTAFTPPGPGSPSV